MFLHDIMVAVAELAIKKKTKNFITKDLRRYAVDQVCREAAEEIKDVLESVDEDLFRTVETDLHRAFRTDSVDVARPDAPLTEEQQAIRQAIQVFLQEPETLEQYNAIVHTIKIEAGIVATYVKELEKAKAQTAVLQTVKELSDFQR